MLGENSKGHVLVDAYTLSVNVECQCLHVVSVFRCCVSVYLLCQCLHVVFLSLLRCCALVNVYMFYAGQGLDNLMTSEMKFLRKGAKIIRRNGVRIADISVCTFVHVILLSPQLFLQDELSLALTSVFTMYDFHIIFLSSVMS